MTTAATSHEHIAEQLRRAYAGKAIAPIRDTVGAQDVAAAYAIQAINTRHWVEAGRRVIGRKIGLTSPAVQKQLGVDQPDFGVLFDDMLIEPGEVLSLRRLIQPKVEAVIAFVLGRDITSPRPSLIDVLSATDFVLPALEVVDSRIENWSIGIVDTVADNASSGLFVLGTSPVDLRATDLRACGMVLEFDGRVVSQGVGAACLGHPANAVRWLGHTMTKLGEPLRAGDIVMSGALGPMVNLTGVRKVDAVIGGMGSIALMVESEEE